MSIKPTLQETLKYQDYNLIPLSIEIPMSRIKNTTALDVLCALKSQSKHAFILESVEDRKHWGRYTFLGYDPKEEIRALDSGDPNEKILALLQKNKSPKLPGLPPFAGGLVGYFAYDYLKYTEKSLNLSTPDANYFQDVDLMLFDKVIAFDNRDEKIVLIVNAPIPRTASYEERWYNLMKQTYAQAERELLKMREMVEASAGAADNKPSGKIISDFKPLFTEKQYVNMVEKAKNYIREGDIFQVVLSNRFEAEFSGSLFEAYCRLREVNPSPYMFYFSGQDFEISGASPETLVKLQDGKLFTYPLAGTRPRGKTQAEDLRLEQELLTDEKELAEHNMLVDLGRNDLGRISKFGSVKVEEYLKILRFSHVMHIGSVISGEIADGLTGLDAINAVLPAGTLSGAPKLRAMEIIEELEKNKRGIYGGAIGYLDFTGNMDTCIAIRLAYKKNGRVFVRSGAGIVADSVPQAEYQECINKAMAVRRALAP